MSWTGFRKGVPGRLIGPHDSNTKWTSMHQGNPSRWMGVPGQEPRPVVGRPSSGRLVDIQDAAWVEDPSTGNYADETLRCRARDPDSEGKERRWVCRLAEPITPAANSFIALIPAIGSRIDVMIEAVNQDYQSGSSLAPSSNVFMVPITSFGSVNLSTMTWVNLDGEAGPDTITEGTGFGLGTYSLAIPSFGPTGTANGDVRTWHNAAPAGNTGAAGGITWVGFVLLQTMTTAPGAQDYWSAEVLATKAGLRLAHTPGEE